MSLERLKYLEEKQKQYKRIENLANKIVQRYFEIDAEIFNTYSYKIFLYSKDDRKNEKLCLENDVDKLINKYKLTKKDIEYLKLVMKRLNKAYNFIYKYKDEHNILFKKYRFHKGTEEDFNLIINWLEQNPHKELSFFILQKNNYSLISLSKEKIYFILKLNILQQEEIDRFTLHQIIINNFIENNYVYKLI